MNLKGNTVVITGGSSGIGFELAKVLTENENQVIICGRSLKKLDKARELVPSLQIFQCDLSKSPERKRFTNWIEENYPQCNILINNAAVVHVLNFFSAPDILSKGELEIQTNYLAPVELTKLFFPLLNHKEKQSKIIFITTGLVYVPNVIYPFYCSAKAALHSFVQILRSHIKDYPIDICEVLMPPVDTPFHQGNPPKRAITPRKAVDEMLNKLEKGEKEIKVGITKLLYLISRISPSFAFKIVNTM